MRICIVYTQTYTHVYTVNGSFPSQGMSHYKNHGAYWDGISCQTSALPTLVCSHHMLAHVVSAFSRGEDSLPAPEVREDRDAAQVTLVKSQLPDESTLATLA